VTLAHIYTVAFQGIEAREVDVQVHVSDTGNGQFNIVGLADKAAAESKECVRVALSAVGLSLTPELRRPLLRSVLFAPSAPQLADLS
jgi:magnesium chelatase family protein